MTAHTANLGLSYLMGAGVAPDPAKGLALIEQAAQSGDPQGAWLAATIASCSFWRPRNWPRAFDYLAQAARVGHEPARSVLQLLAGGPVGSPAGGDDWNAMPAAIDLDAWISPPQKRLIRSAPRIHIVEGFVSPAVCDWLIDRARGHLSRATIYDKATGGTTEDGRRTNSQCDLDLEVGGAFTFVLRARISAVTGRPDAAMEIAKVLHYAAGETFAVHFDYLNPDEPAYAAQLANRGQRTDTFLIYLNDDFTGGETHFPKIELSHRGAKGDAIWFRNVDSAGKPDEDTIHAGLPPDTGEKWLFSQWIRELPRA
jgi:prolyl 4-hydroxylase